MMLRLFASLLAVTAIVGAIWFILELTGVELALVPTLAVAMVLTAALHLMLNRPRSKS